MSTTFDSTSKVNAKQDLLTIFLFDFVYSSVNKIMTSPKSKEFLMIFHIKVKH